MSDYMIKSVRIRQDIKKIYEKISSPSRPRIDHNHGLSVTRAKLVIEHLEALVEEAGRLLDRAHRTMCLMENDNVTLLETGDRVTRELRQVKIERDSYEQMWLGELGLGNEIDVSDLVGMWIDVEEVLANPSSNKEEFLGAVWSFSKLYAYAAPEVLAEFESTFTHH